MKADIDVTTFLLSASARRTNEDHHGIIDLTAFNTDGFDVTGRNVWIHDCVVWDQDDCIAVKVSSSSILTPTDLTCSGQLREHVV